MRTLMFIVIFLFLGAFFIISENNLKMSEKANSSKFVGLYKVWLDKITLNLGEVTGYVVKLDWLPKEKQSEQAQITENKTDK